MEHGKWSWGSTESQSRSHDDVSGVPPYPSLQSPLSSIFATSENSWPFVDSQRYEATPAEFDFCDFTYSEDLPLGVKDSASHSPYNRSLIPDASNVGRLETMPSVSSSTVESDADLTSLRLSLSQRCHRSRVPVTTRNSTSQSGSLDEDTDQSSKTGNGSFGDALRDLSKFLDIIQTHSQGKRTTNNHNGLTCGSTISVIIALDILSTYLQIVAVFDDLCTQLYDNLRTCSQSSVSELQTLPGLQLAGLSVDHGHLQLKILLQAVVHHFQMIERVMGLPVIYRVSGRQDDYTGLLKNNQQYCALMAIVMEDECWKSTLNSLKQNLRNMAQFVYM